MRKLLTVFTPTYNRSYCLHECYESLCRQKCNDFVWLIIDDGSTDDTRRLVESWQRETNQFEIRYVYKENGGLFTGYLRAIEEADTELMICVDSDDHLTDDAVEIITSFWRENGSSRVAGIRALNCNTEGRVIGDLLPNIRTINLIDVTTRKYKIKEGDRKDIVRTDLYKKLLPQEVFENERDMNPSYLLLEISRQYDFLVLNQVICVVDYRTDGMSNTIMKQYLRSPNSFRKMRIQNLGLNAAPFFWKCKETIHYISSSIIAGKEIIRDTPHKTLAVILFPFGFMFSIVVRIIGGKNDA